MENLIADCLNFFLLYSQDLQVLKRKFLHMCTYI